MAPICGIYNFQKGGDVIKNVELMMSAFAYHNLYETLSFQDDFIGLGQRKPSHLAAHKNTLEIYDNLAVVSDSRLDNCDELFEKLDITYSERRECNEAKLIAYAYRKWGEDCPEHLLGNFVFAIWDKDRKKLFLSNDHIGVKSLYYYADSKKFIFATQPKAILASGEIEHRLNENKLIDLIVTQAKFLFKEETWFKNVFALPAGTSLTVGASGSINKRQFWKPQLTKALPFKKEEEILEAFREVMFEVVGDHLRGTGSVTALLSGGLDSSSIVSVAAEILAKQNKQLHTLSAVLPEKDNSILADEKYFIDQMRVFPNVSINYVTEPERGPFDNLEDLIRENDSPLISSRHYLYSAFVEKAQKNSSHAILDGASGELSATFDGAGSYAEMFLRLKWLRLWQELQQRKKLSDESLSYNFRANVIGPVIPNFIRKIRHRTNVLEGVKPKRTSSLIQEDFASEMLRQIEPKLAQFIEHKIRMSPFHRNNQLQIMNNVHSKTTFGGLIFTELGDLEFRYPFRDKRLWDFCLAVPYNLKVRNGYQRALVRLGLDKILPPEIQWRTSKAPFSPDYIRRYNKQLPQVLDFLSGIAPNDPVRQILNINKLTELAKSPIKEGEYESSAGEVKNSTVPIGIYLIYFLRQFAEFKN